MSRDRDPNAPIDMDGGKRKALRRLRAALIAAGVRLPSRPTEAELFAAALTYAAAHPEESAAWAEAIRQSGARSGADLMPRSGVASAIVGDA